MALELFRKQGYHIVGHQAAVKPCLWLKKSLRGEGECYKSRFYGIRSHRCVQMTPTLICNHQCLHCWRPIEIKLNPRGWDEPDDIIEGCISEQRKLVSGYGGFERTDRRKFEEARNPKHFAISLDGEPTLYPYLDELVDKLRMRGITTFVVTNGTRPKVMESIHPSQLYLSINAPNEDIYRMVCNPTGNTWQDFMESVETFSSLGVRKCIRITVIKDINDVHPELYSKMIDAADPDFVEVKAYMHLGYSRRRLERKNMPSHEDVVKFSLQISELSGYKFADESEISRVVLLSRDGKKRMLR